MESEPARLRRRGLLLMAIGVSLVALQSCGPSAPHEEPTARPAANLELRQRLVPDVVVDNILRASFDVTWKTRRRRGDIIRGYNVYVATASGLNDLPAQSPQLAAALYNAETFPGDTDGDISTETIHIENVQSGTRYYVHVRTVFPDGTFGPPSREIEVVPRPRGRLTICPLTGTCEDGYSFRLDQPVDRASVDNDFYIYQTSADFFLASPSRIDRNLRHTSFVDLGPSQSLDDYPRLDANAAGEEKLLVRERHSYGLILDGNRIAKLRAVEIQTSSDNPHVVFEYIYQPFAGNRTF